MYFTYSICTHILEMVVNGGSSHGTAVVDQELEAYRQQIALFIYPHFQALQLLNVVLV